MSSGGNIYIYLYVKYRIYHNIKIILKKKDYATSVVSKNIYNITKTDFSGTPFP